jgi:hypothetical protein
MTAMANDEDDDFDYFLGADIDEEDFILAEIQAERDRDQNIGFERPFKRSRISIDNTTQKPGIAGHGSVDEPSTSSQQITLDGGEKVLWPGSKCKTINTRPEFAF